MGAVLERCGLAEDMLDSMGQLFGTVRGGLGYSVIIVGFILGAITGTVAGQVIAMALISLPVMIRYSYNMRYATGVLAASGTITQLVPPSLVLIVLADQLGRSVGDMYKGAWGPSLLQIAIFALYTFMLGLWKPGHIPGIPKEARTMSGLQLWMKCLRGIIPSAVLIFAVLGSMGGLPWMESAVATPTEAGAMGCVGALLLALLHRRLSWRLLWQAMHGTARLTAMVVFILIGARVFSLVFQGVDGARWIEHQLTSLPGGPIGFLLLVNAFVFFLAFFLDFFEIAFIIVPMLAPAAEKILAPLFMAYANGNAHEAATAALIWFGVVLCVNMQTSFMHPPFGFALFYLRGIADSLFKERRIPVAIKSSDIYMGSIPWVVMQLVLVVIVILLPQTVTVFLEREQQVDIDKVKLEAPPPEQPSGEENQPNVEELFGIKKDDAKK
jgi:tripartite ATP-independent transporter DctM subunit